MSARIDEKCDPVAKPSNFLQNLSWNFQETCMSLDNENVDSYKKEQIIFVKKETNKSAIAKHFLENILSNSIL